MSSRAGKSRAFRAFLLMGGLLWLSGCGYTSQRPFESGVRTVCVEMFQTREFRRDLEWKLTEALAKRIEIDTPYRIADRRRADSVITGEILEVKQNVLGNDFRTDLPRETGATFIVSFKWQDLRTGRFLADRQRQLYTTTYIRPVGETFEDSAVRGLEGLAEEMVESMESAW